MNRYITEYPIHIDFVLNPMCSHKFNRDPENERIDLYIDYIEVNANSIKLGNNEESYILTREMKLYYDFDLEIPIGVKTYSEESNYEDFDIFDGFVSNHRYNDLLNYLVKSMLPENKSINKHRDRLNKTKNIKIQANATVVAAQIIGENIHNSALITSGVGKYM